MRNFHIRSIILGIGIGIILTSLISIIYFAGSVPKLSREEIITEAKKLGMVEKQSDDTDRVLPAETDSTQLEDRPGK